MVQKYGVLKAFGAKRPGPLLPNYKKYGTASSILPHNQLGMYLAYNFQEGFTDENKMYMVSGEYMAETILVRREACIACPVRYRCIVQVTEEPYGNDIGYRRSEFKTNGALGTCTGLFDREAISKANEICNRYGIDTINTGLSISWVMECFEKGILKREDVDELILSWGNADILSLVHKIVYQDGFGSLLSRGLTVAKEKVGKGSDYFAMEVKN